MGKKLCSTCYVIVEEVNKRYTHTLTLINIHIFLFKNPSFDYETVISYSAIHLIYPMNYKGKTTGYLYYLYSINIVKTEVKQF